MIWPLALLGIFGSCGNDGKKPQDDARWAAVRAAMVQTQIAARGVKDERVLSALREVPATSSFPRSSATRPTRITRCPLAKGKPSRSPTSWGS
ncbi:hypothetical protein HRbin09_01897 [bacterium HR09]|nr:hypothetical protein HRbin09_01897 [bacterium HR09]